MICLIAMAVFAVLGIFSARYRTLAKEAFRCVFLKIQLKPCDSGLDQRIRIKVVSKLFKHNKGAAGFAQRHFEAISWVFTILLISSLAYTGYSFYNLAVHGSCTPGNPEGCVFDIEPECACLPQCNNPGCDAEDAACIGDCACPSTGYEHAEG